MGEGFFIPRTGAVAPDIGIIGFFQFNFYSAGKYIAAFSIIQKAT